MLGFSVDISPILEYYSSIADRADEFSSTLLDRLTDEYMYHWENLVGAELKSTRGDYLRAVNTERDGKSQVFMIMPTESNLPMMIEDGADQWDMKEGFEVSGKRTVKNDGGWFLTIPIRHGIPDTTGEIVGKPMPKPVYKAASSMAQGQSLKFDQLPEQYQKLLSNKTTGYQHKFPIYQGLKRTKASSTENEKRSTYVTFRRVSDTSSTDSWVHPGFEARKFMDRTMDWLQGERASQIIDDLIREFL